LINEWKQIRPSNFGFHFFHFQTPLRRHGVENAVYLNDALVITVIKWAVIYFPVPLCPQPIMTLPA
jgi:hypothetical protein